MEKALERLATATGRKIYDPALPYSEQHGALLIDNAYGGYQLQTVSNDGGAVHTLTGGFEPIGLFVEKIRAMTTGAEIAKKMIKESNNFA